MKHKLVDDVNIKINIPTEDLNDLVDNVAVNVVAVIFIYMAADTIRHILKGVVK